MDLARFHTAQAGSLGGYAAALRELRDGRKTSHWIWYVFPQLAGLGRSSTARTFALEDLAEACAYLRDPLLGARYPEIAAVVLDQLAYGIVLETLMGSGIDALKLVSSLTLFRAAALSLTKTDPGFALFAEHCTAILQLAAAQGFPPCAFTLARLAP